MNYVISDIHGDFKRFLKMLKKIKFGSGDILYIIGDIPSRGKETFEMLDWVMKANNVIHIKGNHELFLQQYLEGNSEIIANYPKYGGIPIMDALKSMPNERKIIYLKNLSDLPIYKIISVEGLEYVLTHSGYVADESPIYLEDGTVDIVASIEQWCKNSEYKYLISNDLHYIAASVKFKKLIVGHYPTIYLDCNGIYQCSRYIDIDNGAQVIPQRKLACLRLEDMQEFYV